MSVHNQARGDRGDGEEKREGDAVEYGRNPLNRQFASASSILFLK
jgi:hypothetical protein